MKKIGEVTHYYGNISVAVLKLAGTLNVGDHIKFEGHGADFEQDVSSLQVDHKSVEKAKKGDDVGLKVSEPVREGTKVSLCS